MKIFVFLMTMFFVVASLASDDPVTVLKVTLSAPTTIRTMKDGFLADTRVDLPAGTEVRVNGGDLPSIHRYKDADDTVKFSSTGFVQIVSVESVPVSVQARLPATALNKMNALPGGLYVSSLVIQVTGETFQPLVAAAPGDGFLKSYLPEGRPKGRYTARLKKRFGTRLNDSVELKSLSDDDEAKWSKIYDELLAVSDRGRATSKRLLMIDPAEAKWRSIEFEERGRVSIEGAWSIAVLGTARRHGFANVPCAEFMSEIIRQAYARAGYSHFDDFNKEKKNQLDYKNEASAVVTLATDLNRAGWIPWDASEYIPPRGAIMMHTEGQSPGHTYMSAGDNGRFIIDNGRPQGRDLRTTSAETIAMMYQTGLFFVPPGVQPKRWVASSGEN